ncbi:hypothetical protein GCM10027169_00280 [Gordonia jinhuaensis]|uniref:Uncharacterized protein n=1 Tax=Gordonia jinhuaensis TaxID=1517702 RepID=A0A916WNR4_9ACTN|nr:hypothetical protein [Gordonia jinhuaensis]GGB18283.1 hypothetical protein GCM10011489_02940 [Gordonia jinhuaensis]
MNDSDELPPEVEADLLERQAARLEAQADSRYERSARWYGGGTYNFVSSVSTADEYRKEAQALRRRADAYRELARRRGRI